MAVDGLHQARHQPGEFAGLDFFGQLLQVIGLAVQDGDGMLELLPFFVTVRLQTVDHAGDLIHDFA